MYELAFLEIIEWNELTDFHFKLLIGRQLRIL